MARVSLFEAQKERIEHVNGKLIYKFARNGGSSYTMICTPMPNTENLKEFKSFFFDLQDILKARTPFKGEQEPFYKDESGSHSVLVIPALMVEMEKSTFSIYPFPMDRVASKYFRAASALTINIGTDDLYRYKNWEFLAEDRSRPYKSREVIEETIRRLKSNKDLSGLFKESPAHSNFYELFVRRIANPYNPRDLSMAWDEALSRSFARSNDDASKADEKFERVVRGMPIPEEVIQKAVAYRAFKKERINEMKKFVRNYGMN